jgi:hypothetical protein
MHGSFTGNFKTLNSTHSLQYLSYPSRQEAEFRKKYMKMLYPLQLPKITSNHLKKRIVGPRAANRTTSVCPATTTAFCARISRLWNVLFASVPQSSSKLSFERGIWTGVILFNFRRLPHTFRESIVGAVTANSTTSVCPTTTTVIRARTTS